MVKPFLPNGVRKFWEEFLGKTDQPSKEDPDTAIELSVDSSEYSTIIHLALDSSHPAKVGCKVQSTLYALLITENYQKPIKGVYLLCKKWEQN